MVKKKKENMDSVNRLGVNECVVCDRRRKLDYPFEAKKFTDLL